MAFIFLPDITKKRQKLAILAFGHGLNDFVAGYMLAGLLQLNYGSRISIAGFLLYNLLAFGGQYSIAQLLQKIRRIKLFINIAVCANIIAIGLFPLCPLLSLFLAGCASAVYHVAGGAACMDQNKAAAIGVFAAPGILGLGLAGYLSFLHTNVWIPLLLICCLFFVVISMLHIADAGIVKPVTKQKEKIDRHDLLMVFLLGIISLRSAVWNIIQLIYDHNYTWLLAIALSAFAGKMLGGWLSDKVGWKLYSLVSLCGALPLIEFFRQELILFCIGVGLLQSAIPANTAQLIDALNGQKEKSFALSFGTSIIIGVFLALPVQLFPKNTVLYWLLIGSIICAALLLMPLVTKKDGQVRMSNTNLQH